MADYPPSWSVCLHHTDIGIGLIGDNMGVSDNAQTDMSEIQVDSKTLLVITVKLANPSLL